jgi:hypothetical protein
VAPLKRTQLKKAKWQFPPVKGNVSVAILGDKKKTPKFESASKPLGDNISYSSVETLPSGIWRTSTRKAVHQAITRAE